MVPLQGNGAAAAAVCGGGGRRRSPGLCARQLPAGKVVPAVHRPARARRQPVLDVPPGERHRRPRVPGAAEHQRLGRLGHQHGAAQQHGRQQRVRRLAGRQRRRGVRPDDLPGDHVAHPDQRDHQARRARGARRRVHGRRVHHLRDGGAPGELHAAEHGVAGRRAQRRANSAAPDGRAKYAEHHGAGLPVRRWRRKHRGTQLRGAPS